MATATAAICTSAASSSPRPVLPPCWGRCSSFSILPSTIPDSFLRISSLSTHRWRRAAKFTNFDASHQPNQDAANNSGIAQETSGIADSILPSDMEQAVLQSSQSTAQFFSSGGFRAIVELLLPELEFLDSEGSQEYLWQLAKLFLESLKAETGVQQLKAIFPDAGAAALLRHAWKDADFSFASLNDRKPVVDDDDMIVMISPDYQMLESVEKIASCLTEATPKPLVMWNPHLYSGVVGIGLNVKRLRQYFLSTFTVVYSLRPLPDGAVFRRYPNMWQILIDDKERPGHFVLACEQPNRPDTEDLDMIFQRENDDQEEKPSLTTKVTRMFTTFNRFVKSIS